MDILRSSQAGIKNITGVEINPEVVELLRTRFREESGNAYHIANVTALDGRAFVHNSADRYDIIDLVSLLSEVSFLNSNVQIESYLHTVEAFEDYLKILNTDGVLRMNVFSGAENAEGFRIVAAAATALRRKGLDPSKRIVFFTVDENRRLYGAEPGVLFVKNSPFSENQVDDIVRWINSNECTHFVFRTEKIKVNQLIVISMRYLTN